MIGDQTLHARRHGGAGLAHRAAVLDALVTKKARAPKYDSGGDGPAAADELLARDGERIWRPVTTSLEQTS
jgi:glucose-6-phosphate 1-dehydrogenase